MEHKELIGFIKPQEQNLQVKIQSNSIAPLTETPSAGAPAEPISPLRISSIHKCKHTSPEGETAPLLS